MLVLKHNVFGGKTHSTLVFFKTCVSDFYTLFTFVISVVSIRSQIKQKQALSLHLRLLYNKILGIFG